MAAGDTQVGSVNLRTEVVDGVVKGFATAAYKFKQAVSISSTAAWKNSYYRETATALTGQTGNAVKGIPRGANFPQAVVTWEKISAYVEKYGLEDNIFWEDILTDDVDVQARTMFRIAEGVAKAVDDEIWNVLSESRTVTNIQSVTVALSQPWDVVASAAIIDNLMEAKQKIAEYNYDTTNLIAFISPKDHRSIVNYLAAKGAQFPTIGNEMASNGRAGKLAGVDLVISNSVTASYALVCVPKICATWKEAVPLSTEVITDPYKSVKIRAVEMGVTQLTDPKAVVLLARTQA